MGLKESGLRGSLRNVSVGIAAIPDTVVLRPESDDLDNFEAINGSIGLWDINNDTPVLDGNLSLKFVGSDSGAIASSPGEGLPYYPDVGDEVWVWVNIVNNNTFAFSSIFHGGAERLFNDGLSVVLSGRESEYQIQASGDIKVSESQTYSEGQWYLIRYDTDSDDNDLLVQIRLHDGPTIDDPIIQDHSLTLQDSDLIGQRGIAFEEPGDNDEFAVDKLVAGEGSGNPDMS